jgi:hypothetical protein
MWFGHRCRASECYIPNTLNYLCLLHPKLRATWIPAESTCVPVNMESNVLNLVAMLVTDIALLLIMFAGLIRLRRQGGFKFGLIQLLWRQVRSWSLRAAVLSSEPLICFPCQGYRLALDCNCSRDPASGKSYKFLPPFHFFHLCFTS